MPDVYETIPSKKVKIRWQGGVLDNSLFGAKSGLFYGSQVDLDENDIPVKGTEKRRSDKDFSIDVTKVVNGVEQPTATGLKMVTFVDPVTNVEHTCSYVAVMRAMSEIVSTEGPLSATKNTSLPSPSK